jgi:MFS superfamily sulfate permease-like transporter
MARLLFASLVTFDILVGMVIGCVLAAMVFMGEVNLTLAIVLNHRHQSGDLADQPVSV